MPYTTESAFNEVLTRRVGPEKIQETIATLATLTPDQVAAVKVYGESRFEDGMEDGYSSANASNDA